MKRLLSILLIPLLLTSARAEDFSRCFIPGEVSEYKASWMGIPLARSINTTDAIEENGRKLIRIRTVSKSYKAYAAFYKVNDKKEVIIDPETGLPVRIDLQINEGNIKKSHLTLFNHANQMVQFIDRIANTTNQVEIASDTRDIVSLLYALRNKTPEEIVAHPHTLISNGKFYELNIKIRKETRLKLPEYGKVACIKMEPIADFDSPFLKKGELFFWISKHNLPIITCMKAKVPVGKIKIQLQKVSGTGDVFWDKDE